MAGTDDDCGDDVNWVVPSWRGQVLSVGSIYDHRHVRWIGHDIIDG
jgi:hypothetical protein